MDISRKNLSILPEIPIKVNYLFCNNNILSNLIGSPQTVEGYFDCSNNRLTNLDGSPDYIGGQFDCSKNSLINLAGAPNHVGGNFYCYVNVLSSLFGVSKLIKEDLYIKNNPNLLDVSDIWDSDVGGVIYFNLNSKMAILPLIKFEIYPYNAITSTIHKKNRGSSKQNIIDFQYDLIEKGFADNAEWKPI